MLNISAPPVDDVDNATPSGHVMSIGWTIYKGIGYFVMMFLYILSIYTCYDVGLTTGAPSMLLGAIGAAVPFVAFWGFPWIFFFRRLIYTTDLVV
jgi:hypothetical protein